MIRKELDKHSAKILGVLSRHIGREKAIDMGALYCQVFGREYQNKISDTRDLRKVITILRQEGVPICSISSPNGGGYYLASAGSELEDYLGRLRRRALKSLWMESKVRRIGLAELLGQMQMNISMLQSSRVHGSRLEQPTVNCEPNSLEPE